METVKCFSTHPPTRYHRSRVGESPSSCLTASLSLRSWAGDHTGPSWYFQLTKQLLNRGKSHKGAEQLLLHPWCKCRMSPRPPPPPRLLRDVREGYPRLSGSGGRGRLRPHATRGWPGRRVAGLPSKLADGFRLRHTRTPRGPSAPLPRPRLALVSRRSPRPLSPKAHTHSPRPPAQSLAQRRRSLDRVEPGPRWRLRPRPLRTPGGVRAPPHAAGSRPRPG